MKKHLISLFLLLFACGSAYAQTLKWTFPVTAPTTFSHDSSFIQNSRSDTHGNICVVIGYTNGGDYVGFQLLWLNSNGTLIHSEEGTSIVGAEGHPQPLRVSKNDLVVVIRIHQSIPDVLRHYRRHGPTTTVSDLVLNSGDILPFESDSDVIDDIDGFFVFGGSPGSPPANITEVRRYTVK